MFRQQVMNTKQKNSEAQESPLQLGGSGKHLLFIDEDLIMGGIATLITRVSRLLVNDGWRVTLLVKTIDSEVKQMLPEKLEVIEMSTSFHWMYFPEYAISRSKTLGLNTVDIIFATGIVANWLGSILSALLSTHPKLLSGVYTASEFCYPRSMSVLNFGDHLRTAQFDKNVPDSSKLFMSETIRQYHVKSFGRTMCDAHICVLPIDEAMFTNRNRHPNRFKIVSVGRLCKSKTYNLYMLEVVRHLRDKGYPVCWEVYGTGEMEHEMRRRIMDANLDACVRLHGNLAYQSFNEALADAGAFVGMGTAIIEASFCRVASVVAVVSSETEKTYGYVYNLPFGACGERLATTPSLSTTELLERLFLISEAEYGVEMERTWQYVQPYGQQRVYETLLRCFQSARPCKGSYWRFVAYNLHGLLRKVFRRSALPS